ncbi:hypothetical protein [Aquaticitalea lipolytica]|uniref:hypothetical protein n=1 Tax=Aquaticitalea lipolytica TaxID=1247562 RepID=UPI0024BBCFC2|nr:hypothetical protein [Aquaticitalea lipolytica]
MKSKKTVYILLLISGACLAFSLLIMDYSKIVKGENLLQLTLPIAFILTSWNLLDFYIEAVKKEQKNKD